MEGLAEVKKSNNEFVRLRKLVKANPHDKKNKIYKKEIRVEHYNAIRRVTEVMYLVGEYYPEVRNLSPVFVNRFAEVVYAKVQELYKQIGCLDLDVKPETEDEKQCIAALIYTLQDVEKMIIPYLPSDKPAKRIRKFVDYTVMVSIEPYDDDGITNIWLDTTSSTDPDYEFEEDEEDDDEVDPYLVDEVESIVGEEPEEDEHDYSEDEDYVPEDEEEVVVSEIAARVKVGRKTFKEGNHTRFIYDDDC
jgi:hypothetical protein